MVVIQLIVNGLLLGCIYALIGLGLTIVFGIVGLTNLAHGEFVILGAYASTLLAGALGVDPVLTLFVTVPSMFLAGYFLQTLLINHTLKRGSEPALLVTFGVSIILQDGMLLLLSADARHGAVPYATASIRFAGLDISVLNLVLCTVSVLCVAALTLFLNRSYTGRAIRAVADDPDAAKLSGINVMKIYSVAMGVAMASAAVAGLCVAMKWTFYPSSGGQYLLTAFIVVVIGGMGSIPGTLLAGLGFGLAQVVGGANYGLLISYVVMLIALAAHPGNKIWNNEGEKPASGGSSRETQLCRSRYACMGFAAAAAVLFALGLGGLLSANVMRYLIQIFLYICLGEAWNLLSGFAGMTSLGQQLYVGLAGYAVAAATGLFRQPLSIGLLCAVAAAAAAAALLSFVLFRMKGMYFAIATWVAAEAAEKVFLNWKLVGQGSGMTIRLSPYPETWQIYLIALTACCLTLAAVYLLVSSKLGMGLLAMRDEPAAASAIGINLTKIRFIVYVLSALISAVAGGIFFLSKGTIYPDSGFSVGWTVSAVFICIIGGTGTISGPVAGAVLYVLMKEYLAHYPGWSNIMLGVITLLVIFFLPDGIVGSLRKSSFRNLFRKKTAEGFKPSAR